MKEFKTVQSRYLIGQGSERVLGVSAELIHAAILNQDYSQLRSLCARCVDVNCGDWRGRRPLIFAAQAGRGSAVEILLMNRACATLKDKLGYDALWHAIHGRHLNVAGMLLGEDATLQNTVVNGVVVVKGVESKTIALIEAIRCENSEAVRLLLYSGASVILKIEKGCSVLDIARGESDQCYESIVSIASKSAIARGDKEVIEKLDVIIKTIALIKAINDRGENNIKLLLDTGASATLIVRKDGRSALDVASGLGSYWYVLTASSAFRAAIAKDDGEAFERVNASGVEFDKNGTLLINVIQQGKDNVAMKLMELGYDVNVKSLDGCTALVAAVDLGKKNLVEMLISRGADINVRCQDRTLMCIAMSRGFIDVKNFLFEAGARD